MTGGAIGSLFAQFFHLSAAERKTLLVAGAAAGMTAIFGSPIAAVTLAVELLLFEWKPRSFIPVAIAAVPETAIGVRNGAVFKLPSIIDIEEGQTVTLEIRADGYVSQLVVLDGSEQSKLVKLEGGQKARPGSPARPTATAVTPKSTEVRDPWATKQK